MEGGEGRDDGVGEPTQKERVRRTTQKQEDVEETAGTSSLRKNQVDGGEMKLPTLANEK